MSYHMDPIFLAGSHFLPFTRTQIQHSGDVAMVSTVKESNISQNG